MLTKLLLIVGVAGTEVSGLDCRNPIDPAKRIDTTFVRVADVDGDSAPDTIRLRLTASRFDSPFAREFSIVSKGRQILSSSTVDDWLDASFREITFGLPCSGYLQCKCIWYADTILNRVTQSGTRLGRGVFDVSAPNSIYRIAADHLIQHCRATSPTAQEAIRRAIVRLREGSLFVVEPLTPAVSGPAIAWFPEFSCFAPIYRD